MNHRLPAIGVEVQQDLGVGVGLEGIALGFELLAQLAVVVDFAVEGDAQAAIGSGHRLGTGGGEIDDGEAAVGEADALIVGNP